MLTIGKITCAWSKKILTTLNRPGNPARKWSKATIRDVETRGRGRGWGGEYILSNNLTVSPNSLSMVYFCIPPIIWSWCTSERRCPLEFGEKSVPLLVKTFFFIFTWIWGKKVFQLWRRLFFLGLHLICSPEQNRGRGSSPRMLKIGQNWGKIAYYPPPILSKDRHPWQWCMIFSLSSSAF